MTGDCKDCRTSLRVSDVWKLYNPNTVSLDLGGKAASFGSKTCGGSRPYKKRGLCCGKSWGKCVCYPVEGRGCADQFKTFWDKGCEIPVIKVFQDQPWFRNKVVQSEWGNFISQFVTPANIGCLACPAPEDWAFRCHQNRALFGPQVPCVWDLPKQDPCDCTIYGFTRDWRRFNEDQRALAAGMSCGENGKPICAAGDAGQSLVEDPKSPSKEWPPYLGKPYGARYMGWAHPTQTHFPRVRPFNYQSYPKC